MKMDQKVKRVPVVMQMESLECGAASLAMILAYYKKWILLEKVRSDCGVSRDGSKASNILKAAIKYGLEAQGYRYEPNQLRNSGKFPCIIHWNFNHFVVLCGFRGNYAYINDPARGNCKISMEQFDESFTGICLYFEPGDEFVAEGKPKSMMSFIRKRMIGTRTAILFVVITTLLVSLIGIIQPAFSRIFLDRLLTGQNPEWFYPFLAGICLLTVISFTISAVEAIYTFKLNGKLAIVANASFLWHVLRLPMGFFSQRMAGDIAMRQSLSEGVANTLISTLAPLILKGGMMIFYFVVMVRYSPLLTAVGMIAMLINLLMSRIISHKRVNITRVQMRDEGKLAGTTVAGIEMIETIKASGAENGFFEKWAGYQASMNTQEVGFSKLNHYLQLIPSIVSVIVSNVILLLGIYLTMKDQFTVGMLLAFQGFLSSFTAPAESFIAAGQTIQEMRTNMERIEDVMEYPTDVEYDNNNTLYEEKEFQKLSGEVIMKHVTFGYSKLSAPLIEDFNLHLKPGSRVAFVGTSGCGKSTLSKLISGLYQPWGGEILFDGKPISAINRSIFTSSVAVVDQDIILFEDTIGNNIKMWDHSIEGFEVILAAKDASLHEDIMGREGGYEYSLMEGGKDLSGGQRQRLEIARVLAQDPTLIIMDEATSALDAKTEYEVVESIKNRGITCIVIAHRLSTIRNCDEIIVLEKGKVVERGSHEELYQKGGTYTALVSSE